ncbi:MAG: ring-cleaving dioxygenase [Acidobacteriota bacterium]|nr:ring-cleaving dioxygenase [Acidobacteriota bacterium]
MDLSGIHHLTAISAAIRENRRFYTQTLGMRLVKRSVNQDDVSAYHLFYADGQGSPGTDITFFDWPAPPERRGARSITLTCLRVNGADTLTWWAGRFTELGVKQRPIAERDGRLTLAFEDPEGQRLALVDDGGAGDPPVVWDRSPVPADRQIRGLGPIVMSVPTLYPTDGLLTRVMNMRPVRDYPHPDTPGSPVHVFEMGAGGPHAELHVAVQPDLPAAQQGAGGVHHVAFRTIDANYDAWAERLNEFRIPNSGKVDRFWFRSLYVREPNGVLFEIATDGPGFGVDEDHATLGEKVVLPPFLEPQRRQIVANLKGLD